MSGSSESPKARQPRRHDRPGRYLRRRMAESVGGVGRLVEERLAADAAEAAAAAAPSSVLEASPLQLEAPRGSFCGSFRGGDLLLEAEREHLSFESELRVAEATKIFELELDSKKSKTDLDKELIRLWFRELNNSLLRGTAVLLVFLFGVKLIFL
ncbi:hypothetical protein NHQ30_004102 [Ciborinia camelliae]|nr:hypothetical protein NHQ30_004102 [Ciborinia camelliae]